MFSLNPLTQTLASKLAAVAATAVLGAGVAAAAHHLVSLHSTPLGNFDIIAQGSYEVVTNTNRFFDGRPTLVPRGGVAVGENIYLDIKKQSVGGVASVGPINDPLEGYTSIGKYSVISPQKNHNPARFILKLKNNSGRPVELELNEIKKMLYADEWMIEFVKVSPATETVSRGEVTQGEGLVWWPSEVRDKRVIIQEGTPLGELKPGEEMQLEAYVLVGAELGLEDQFYKKRLAAIVQQVNRWREEWEEDQQPPEGTKITGGGYDYPRFSFFNDVHNMVGLSVFPSLIRTIGSSTNKLSISFDLATEDFYPNGVSKLPSATYDQVRLLTRAVPSLFAARQILQEMDLAKFTKLHDVFYDVPEQIGSVGAEPSLSFSSTACGAEPSETSITTTRLMRFSSQSPMITLELAQKLKNALDAAFGVEPEVKRIEVTSSASPVYFDGKVITVRHYHSRTEMCGFAEEQNKNSGLSHLQTVSGYTSSVVNSIIRNFLFFQRRLMAGAINSQDWDRYKFYEERRTETGNKQAFSGKAFYMAGPIGLDMSQYDYYEQQAIGNELSAWIGTAASRALEDANYGERYKQELADFQTETKDISQEASQTAEEEVSGFLAWSVDSRRITTYFGQRYVFGIHNGLDIATQQGDPVYAAEEGKVMLVEIQNYRTSLLPSRVVILHPNGLVTVYLHMRKINVMEGEMVERGQRIGEAGGAPNTLGAGFYSTGPHLHFEVWEGGEVKDPLPYLTASQSISFSGLLASVGILTGQEDISTSRFFYWSAPL